MTQARRADFLFKRVAPVRRSDANALYASELLCVLLQPVEDTAVAIRQATVRVASGCAGEQQQQQSGREQRTGQRERG